MSQPDSQISQSLKEKQSLGHEFEVMMRTPGWEYFADRFARIKEDYMLLENAKGSTLEARLEALEVIKRIEAIWVEVMTEGKSAQAELSSPPEDY